MREGGSHQQKFTGHIQIQLFHGIDVTHVLIRNFGNRNVENIDVVGMSNQFGLIKQDELTSRFLHYFAKGFCALEN